MRAARQKAVTKYVYVKPKSHNFMQMFNFIYGGIDNMVSLQTIWCLESFVIVAKSKQHINF